MLELFHAMKVLDSSQGNKHTLELLACAIPSNSQDVEDFEVFLSPVPGPPLELLHRVVDFVLGD